MNSALSYFRGSTSAIAAGEQGSTSASPVPKEGEKKEASPKRDKKSPSPTEDPHGSPLRPVEREVKERTETTELNSMIRTMYFCQTYILNGKNSVYFIWVGHFLRSKGRKSQGLLELVYLYLLSTLISFCRTMLTVLFSVLASTPSSTLWVGTNGGTIIALTIVIPDTAEKREEIGVQCQLAKEVHLRHRAPVLALTVVDGQGFPLDNPRPTAVAPQAATAETAPPAAASPSPAHDHGHRLIVCSEEQIKVKFLYLKPTYSNNNPSIFSGFPFVYAEAESLQVQADGHGRSAYS